MIIPRASTNVAMANGTPDNFTFVTSPTPLLSNPTPAGFHNYFIDGAITNPYSYFDGQLIATTVPTNVTPGTPAARSRIARPHPNHRNHEFEPGPGRRLRTELTCP